jgi:hypothetical protein
MPPRHPVDENMDNHERLEILNKGMKIGLAEAGKHSEPSPETKSMFDKLSKNMDYINQRMDKFDKNLESLSNKVEDRFIRFDQKIDCFIAAVDNKYARKGIEADVKEIEEKVDKLKDRNEGRQYDWLKYTITSVIALGVGLLIHHLTD